MAWAARPIGAWPRAVDAASRGCLAFAPYLLQNLDLSYLVGSARALHGQV